MIHQKTIEVYAVSFRPFEERAGVGGFEWRYKKEDAESFFESEIAREDADNYIYRLVKAEVNESLDNERITNELDNRIGELEYDLPALRERVPLMRD